MNIFKIYKEERWLALGVFLYTLMLNVLVIIKYYDRFTKLSDNYRSLFVKTFHISGFDPLTYEVVSKWTTSYNIYRHPLLAFFMYIPCQINQGLIMLTGHNCVQFVVAVILMFCTFYSALFLYRIFRSVIEICCIDAILLTAFYFSFAYIMLSISVPDHFCFSMFMLILILYLSGMKIRAKQTFTKCQMVLIFFITAGISLNNGIKLFLADLFTKEKYFWKIKNLFLVVFIPSIFICSIAFVEWQYFEKPKVLARDAAIKKRALSVNNKMFIMFKDTTSLSDPLAIKKEFGHLLRRKAYEKYIYDHRQPWNLHKGKPLGKNKFSRWTDVSTPRVPTIIENLFGESIMLHQDFLLQDTLCSRPVILNYRYVINYILEFIIILLFVIGIRLGIMDRFMWLVMSFFAFDIFIHLVLGFGINEIYIMGAHWLFVLPIIISYIFKTFSDRIYLLNIMRTCILILLIFLYTWNISLYINYLSI